MAREHLAEDRDGHRRGWVALIPQKRLSDAKQRIELPPGLRRQLAVAMLRDTVDSVLASTAVCRVVVAWQDRRDIAELGTALGIHHVVAAELGLNEALGRAATIATNVAPDAFGEVVVPSDLPALRPEHLTDFLESVAFHPSGFIADRSGNGTTVLTARRGHRLPFRYGPDSAGLHRPHSAEQASPAPGLCLDVDSLDALASLDERSLGSRTRQLLAQLAEADSRSRRHDGAPVQGGRNGGDAW